MVRFLTDYLCDAGQKQLVGIDIAWEIASLLTNGKGSAPAKNPTGPIP
jgi:hypothetical protein